ncbi:unnamed protein product [Soboliphyme baturini]|uniref:Metallo-beta-lactamase domain-containing protein 1 n=1 Tax=Soboliphyme baturini TaxID=241478 RepID=A0A183IDS1_9BILA|nr:unnamed protein product [Soboliphyme baturini]
MNRNQLPFQFTEWFLSHYCLRRSLHECHDVYINILIVDSVRFSELQLHGILPTDINFLVCTHGHLDHIGNLNLFPTAKIILDNDVCSFPSSSLKVILEFGQEAHPLTSNVSLMRTTGHTSHDISVVVTNAINGGSCCAFFKSVLFSHSGDIFECEHDDVDRKWEQLSWNPEMQKESRQLILALADYVIPGHGEIFCSPFPFALEFMTLKNRLIQVVINKQ